MIKVLDFRLYTFFVLCQELNYTNTAKKLHISQPAVSQHIKYLEEQYNTKLFKYKDKKLSLTPSGHILYKFVSGINSSSKRIENLLEYGFENIPPIIFGTTLTVGEFTMPKIIEQLIIENPNISLKMEVGNTKTLLSKLEKGSIDFAILEGQFDKSDYITKVLSKEEFIGVCSPTSRLSKDKVFFDEIFQDRLIIREEGSGSRDIFESILYEHNYTMDSFKRKIEIGNINSIKKLVEKDLGITFLYKKAVLDELNNNSLKQINIKDFKVIREYTFVFLKHNLHRNEFMNWFEYFKKHL